jgi:hypothetical protein
MAHREPRDALQRRSPPKQGGGLQSLGTRGSTEALPNGEVGSGATGHVTALEPSLSGRRDPEPQDV